MVVMPPSCTILTPGGLLLASKSATPGGWKLSRSISWRRWVSLSATVRIIGVFHLLCCLLLLLLLLVEEVRVFIGMRCGLIIGSRCGRDAWVGDCGETGLLKAIALDTTLLLRLISVRIVLRQRLLLEMIQLDADELDGLREVLAAILQLALHLAAAGEVVADDGLVVRVERVRILGFDHDLVGLEQALHAGLPLGLVLLIQLLDGLLIKAG